MLRQRNYSIFTITNIAILLKKGSCLSIYHIFFPQAKSICKADIRKLLCYEDLTHAARSVQNGGIWPYNPSNYTTLINLFVREKCKLGVKVMIYQDITPFH